MNWLVLVKMVPDVVEELEIAADGRSLDTEWLRWIVSEPDDHAVEQAILLKERFGGAVTVIGLEAPELDDVLCTAVAKGADRAVKLAGEWGGVGSVGQAEALAAYLESAGFVTSETLILTGSQAIDDLDGEVGAYLAARLGLPYLSVVTQVAVAEDGREVTVVKEFAQGLRGEYALWPPAILGIQSAEKPPHYVPVAKIRSAMKEAPVETVEMPEPTQRRLPIERMFKQVAPEAAEMLAGPPEEVASQIAGILADHGLF